MIDIGPICLWLVAGRRFELLCGADRGVAGFRNGLSG